MTSGNYNGAAVYTYQAALLCEDCTRSELVNRHDEVLLKWPNYHSGEAPRISIDDMLAEVLRANGCDPENESTWDSDKFPKSTAGLSDEADTPQHCDHCNCFLHNRLTNDGYEYVLQALRDNDGDSDALKEWRDYYGDDRFPDDMGRSINDLLDADSEAIEVQHFDGETCYYKSDVCRGDLWECVTCGEKFCSETHNHANDRGINVECVGCERERKAAEDRDDNITLDTATQLFRDAPSSVTAATLTATAQQYADDEMITQAEADALNKEAAPYLPQPDDDGEPIFYRTIYRFEVLSESPIAQDSLSLSQLAELTDTGDCVGRFLYTEETALDGLAMAQALIAAGSEPGFFQLDDRGNPLSDGDSDIRVNVQIKAEVHSDDRHKAVDFDAAEWFAQATDDDIRELHRIEWGGDYKADEVAQYYSLTDTKTVLDYAADTDDVGYECHVDAADAMAWLAKHRPALARELESAIF